MSYDTTKPTKWLCTQRRLRSAWASAQSDQSLSCALSGSLMTQAFFMRTAKTLIRLDGCPGWSESSLGAHSFGWFCHVAAHIVKTVTETNKILWQTWTSRNVKDQIYELPHDKINKMICAPSEDSDQPGHPPSLIRVFAVRLKRAWALSYLLSSQRRFWSDWIDAQADPSLHWAHMSLCWFCH